MAQVRTSADGKAISAVPPSDTRPSIDYRKAQPLPLPQSTRPMPTPNQMFGEGVQTGGEPKVSPGNPGNGQLSPKTVPTPPSESGVQPQAGATPFEFGTSNLPFSTARAAAFNNATQNFYPLRATGKLFFKKADGLSYICTASLIKRGVAVTAAHCVANFGQSQFYSSFQYIPAYDNGSAPYGTWGGTPTILTSYFNGTQPCAQSGVVCQDDVAVIAITASSSGAYPGTQTGWYGYGTGGFNFNSSKQASITQLGYPKALDGGLVMQRNNAQGSVIAADSNNTEMGSLMTGGSSGGPWLANFGMAPTLNGTSHGTAPNNNVVIGVTSFGSTNDAFKRQGASSFTASNIQVLVNTVCNAVPARCQ